MSDFGDWVSNAGDTILDTAAGIGRLWAEDKFTSDKDIVEKEPAAAGSDTAGAGVVQAGQPAGNVSMFGLQMNKTALYVVGGAILGVVILKMAR